MQCGMPSLIECAGIEENVRLCRKFGLDFIELNMNLPMFQPDELSRTIDYAQKHGVGITLHADENLNCMDFSVPVADAYLSVLVDTIQIARECGVPTVNLHLNRGVYFSLPDRKIFLYDTYRERYLDRVQEMARSLRGGGGEGRARSRREYERLSAVSKGGRSTCS